MDYLNFSLTIKLQQVLYLLLFLFMISPAKAQEEEKTFEVYGYIKTDIGYNIDQMNPDWIDLLRVTKLPQCKDQFAPNGKIYFGMRDTRIGFNNWSNTPLGKLKINFEFDLFGVGPNVGQTIFRFRKAYGELGKFLIGQTESVFTDVEVTPNTLDYGAPPGRAYVRTIQVRYSQTSEHNRWAVALEQPGATSDEGIYANRIELQNVRAQFKLPDLTAQYRRIMKSGYIELAGVLEWIRWKNTVISSIDLSGEELGWGFYISSKYQLNSKTLFKGQLVYGKGIENYLTDAAFDIGIKNNFANPFRPILGVALPVLGGLAFFEHKWTSKWSSTIGYSGVRIYNADAQAGNAFQNGNYAIVNLQYQPVSQLQTGVELQWGQRRNFSDGFSSSTVRVQFSGKYNISHAFYKNVNK
ncbi:MAG: hypothetical protein J7502_10545 [Flavisolibacter sp.]|nr:hypothetical protein [Flavisolibacter sp.]